jgi:hypothetical protein
VQSEIIQLSLRNPGGTAAERRAKRVLRAGAAHLHAVSAATVGTARGRRRSRNVAEGLVPHVQDDQAVAHDLLLSSCSQREHFRLATARDSQVASISMSSPSNPHATSPL